jgi:hypothetical protein
MERFLRWLQCDGSIAVPTGLKSETVAYITREWESLLRRLAYFR